MSSNVPSRRSSSTVLTPLGGRSNLPGLRCYTSRVPASSLAPHSSLTQIVYLFLKLGFTAFGGPAAHIAIFREEVVVRRKWLDDQQFLDLLGATNLIPGPNSTEVAIHVGFLRGGWPGLALAGACFTLPAMLIVMGLAWIYVQYRSLPQVEGLLYGIKPVLIAIILHALWGLTGRAIKGPATLIAGLGSLALYLVGFHPVPVLLLGGAFVLLVSHWDRMRKIRLAGAAWALANLGLGASAVVPLSLSLLFLTFFKIGALLYGSGYVLLAFLHADFVDRLGWLSEQQLLDAVAIGQVTPGPLFTSATFIGYTLFGVPGALVATLGIFLPSFIFVALSNPFIPRIRRSPLAGSLLDGVNVASLGLMAAVTWQLGLVSLIDPITILVALAALILMFRFRLNTTWLILGGSAVGLIRSILI